MTNRSLGCTVPISAEDILLKYWDGKIPVNVEAIALRMGVAVIPYSFEEADTVSEVVTHDGAFAIRIAKTASGTRRQWALAHSLGHIALGHVAAE